MKLFADRETTVKVSLALEGEGIEIDVPVGFLGHMLELLLFNAGCTAG